MMRNLKGSNTMFVVGLVVCIGFRAICVGAVTTVCKPNSNVDPVLIPYIRADVDPFCMNRGLCKPNYEENPDFPCDCEDGYDGPHCEFKEDEVPEECDLECFNGGVCQVGIRSYMDLSHLPSSEDYMYCRCRQGFYGDQCEIEGKICGTTHCLNGGECVQIEHHDGRVTDHCDCTQAMRDGQPVAGRFCQATATSTCSSHDSVEPTDYCVNGGTCNTDPSIGCECSEGHHGALCEFSDEEQDEWICNMDCGENGFCRKGAKDTSYIDNFDFNDRRLTQRYTEEFEHCRCAPGWVGLHCDVQMDVCPGHDTICLHGSRCALSDTSNDFVCDCGPADTQGFLYTGKYCQYHSTSYCTIDGEKPKGDGDAFCTNNGQCKDFVMHEDPHPGCICGADFGGEHCEILLHGSSRTSSNASNGKERKTSGGGLFAIILFTFLAILLIVFLIVWHRRRRRQQMYKRNVTGRKRLSNIRPYLGSRKRRSSTKKSLSFNPNLESIHEDEYLDDPFQDVVTDMSGGSESDSGSESITFSSPEAMYPTESGSEYSGAPPPLPNLGTFDSNDLKDDLRYAFSDDQDDPTDLPNKLSNDSSSELIYTSNSDYSTDGYGNAKQPTLLALPSSSASFEEAHRHELTTVHEYDPDELEEMVQKRRRAPEDRILQRNDSSEAPSEIASMSSMSNSTAQIHNSIQISGSLGSFVGRDVTGNLSSVYSLSQMEEDSSASTSTDSETGSNGEFTDYARLANTTSLGGIMDLDGQRNDDDAEDGFARTAQRAEHYKAIGSTRARAPKPSEAYPWRGGKSQTSTVSKSSDSSGNPSVSDPSGYKMEAASKGVASQPSKSSSSGVPSWTAISITPRGVFVPSDDSSGTRTEDEISQGDASTISSGPQTSWEETPQRAHI